MNKVFGVSAEEVFPILKKHILADGMKYIFDFDSKGSYVTDALTGKKLLDCFGQYASLPLGYNHPKILDKIGWFLNTSECKVVNSDIYTREMAAFVKTFFDKVVPEGFDKAFFIEGGSNAVENCLKIAFDWFARKNNLNDKEAQKLDIVHLKDAFHGRGGYTMSLTNSSFDKIEFFPRFQWTKVINPKIPYPFDNIKMDRMEKISLKQTEEAMKKGNVAAFIMEPIQGEGGNNMFRKEYFQSIRKLCDKYGALLIFDEVQTGFGGTGKWWAFQHYGVKPDLFAFGKKSQVCGVVADMKKIGIAKNNCFEKSSRINSTWGGNIVDMVRSKIIIDIIAEDDCKLLKHVEEVGVYLKNKLQELTKSGLFKRSKISNVRGIGTIVAFDLPTRRERDEMLYKLNENMIILGCGEKSIRFRPALTFSKVDVDTAINYIRKAL